MKTATGIRNSAKSSKGGKNAAPKKAIVVKNSTTTRARPAKSPKTDKTLVDQPGTVENSKNRAANIVKNIKQGLKEVEMIRQRKIKAQSLDELLNDL
jgi:GTPase Era involved in 16S rRNA processing